MSLSPLSAPACAPACVPAWALASALGVALSVWTPAASASGYLTTRFGGEHGNAANPTAYSVYFNPGAMGGVTGTQVVVDGSIAWRKASYDRPESALSPLTPASKSDPNYRAANTGRASLSNIVGFPFLGIVTDLGQKNLRLGFASYVPFGGSADWAKNDTWKGNAGYPGAVDGPQRWVNINGQILAWYNTLALAYRFEDAHVTIGASFSGIVHRLQTLRARNAEGGDDVRTAAGNLKEGRALLEAKGLNFAFAVGLYWEPTADVRLGLSYNSQPGLGSTRLKGTLEQQFGTAAGVAAQTDIEFLQAYPDVIRAAGSFRADKQWELRLAFDYVRWSVLKGQCVLLASTSNGKDNCELDDKGGAPAGSAVTQNVVRNWTDSVGIHAGAGYFATDALEIFAGLTVSTSPVPKETIDAATIDSTRLYSALGARYLVSKAFALAGSYTNIYFVPVDTQGKSQHYTFAGTSRTPSTDGVYKAMIHYVNVNLTFSF